MIRIIKWLHYYYFKFIPPITIKVTVQQQEILILIHAPTYELLELIMRPHKKVPVFIPPNVKRLLSAKYGDSNPLINETVLVIPPWYKMLSSSTVEYLVGHLLKINLGKEYLYYRHIRNKELEFLNIQLHEKGIMK